ncbi:MAG: choice-of-anchor J domain-containing protein [Bacteroidales bacterium]|nr:choice-of-anchor J domain-containing protein [Bacteroidales bacterium]
MKKIFSLFIALFVMSFCAQAQVSFINEGFESTTLPGGWTIIDADGDGYNWDCATPNGVFDTHSGTGCIASASFVNYVGALTPDNWLITPQYTVSAGDTVSFWYAGQDASYCSENFGVYISTTGTATTDFTSVYQGTADSVYQRVAISLASYVGQNIYIAIRHYNTTDMYWLNIDDFQLGTMPTTPTFAGLPASLDFGQVVVNSNATMTVPVVAYSLTNDITVTTAAPFSVSADGTTFGTTATLTATTGSGNTTNATLYVRYSPTASGANTGSMTVASTGATTQTVALAGEGMNCTVSTFPYNFSFDNAALAECWEIVDANNDASTFTIDATNGYAYYTYNSSNAANDYLISPEFVLTGNEMCSFDYWAASTSYPESFMVYAYGATDTVVLVNTVNVTNTSSAPATQYASLSTLTGTYRIAIKCTSAADEFRFYVDNFSVTASNVELTATPASIDFGTVPTSITGESTIEATILNATSDITVTTAAPFGVSLDGTTYSTSVTITTPTTAVANQTIYVNFAPTAATTYTGEVVFSTTGAADTVSLTGTGLVCDVISTFPFVEPFDETSTTLGCWSFVDANNDGSTFSFMAYDETNTGVAVYMYNSTNAANDWLISPEFALPAGAFLSYDYVTSGYYPENYSVWVIPQNATYATATNILTTQTVDNDAFANNILDLSAYANQTVRIAFKAESAADQYYFVVDNVTINAASEPTITVDPTSMTFSGSMGNATGAQTANVVGMALANDITITATAPFEVSTDGSSYATTATIAQASVINTNIYVRYNPTAVGSDNGTVTLTSGTATATITVTGTAIDCSTAATLPFFEGFESGLNDCWTNIDNDGDGFTWNLLEATDGISVYEGSYGVSSFSYDNPTYTALTPDNWLITPAIAIPAEGANISWYVAAQDPDYPADHYEVMISTTGTNPADFTSVYEETIQSSDFELRGINIPQYAGQNIHVAFVHNECTDMFMMKLDAVNITAGTGVNDFNNNVSVYPNPATDVLNVSANSNIQSVEIMNLMGQTVQSYNANDLFTQINISSLSNGMYMVRVNTENGVINHKFTVAR